MRRFLASFRNAARGVRFAWLDESHVRLQVWSAYTALAVGVLERVPATGLALLALAAGLVLAAETANSALEATVDLITREWRAEAGRAKDIAAGAVLLASATAAAVGILVLGPGLPGLVPHVEESWRRSPAGLGLAGVAWVTLGILWLRGAGRPRQGGRPPRSAGSQLSPAAPRPAAPAAGRPRARRRGGR